MPIFKVIVKTLVILSICAFGLLGIPIKDDTTLKTHIGQFTIQPYQYGLTINNEYKSFYNISPYNFHIKQKPLFDWSENAFPIEWQNKNFMTRIWNGFLVSIGQGNAKATIKTVTKEFVATTRKQDNKLEISYQMEPTSEDVITKTISFNKDDLVLDDQLVLLSNPGSLDLEEINKLHKSNIKIENTDSFSGKSIFIMNINNSGVIKLDLSRIKNVLINNNERIIEMEPIDKENKSMKLEFYSNIKSALEGN